MVDTSEKEPTFEVPYSGSTLGWDVLVAPVSQNAHEKLPSNSSAATVGPVPEFSGG